MQHGRGLEKSEPAGTRAAQRSGTFEVNQLNKCGGSKIFDWIRIHFDSAPNPDADLLSLLARLGSHKKSITSIFPPF